MVSEAFKGNWLFVTGGCGVCQSEQLSWQPQTMNGSVSEYGKITKLNLIFLISHVMLASLGSQHISSHHLWQHRNGFDPERARGSRVA